MDVWFVKVQVGFREEVDKFIEAAKKHATTLQRIRIQLFVPVKIARTVWHGQM